MKIILGNTKTNGQVCGKDHHKLLHGSTHVALNRVQIAASVNENPSCLMGIVAVNVNDKAETVVFMDQGANTSLITHELANKLGLHGRFSIEWVELAGEEAKLREVLFYTLKWKLPDGSTRKMSLMGMEHITTNHRAANVDVAYQLFPHVPSRYSN